MASKKQIHRKSRIPGIESERRIQNKLNVAAIKLMQHGIGIVPRVRKAKIRICPKLTVIGYDKENKPIHGKPHVDMISTTLTLYTYNLKLLNELGHIPRKTKIKQKKDRVTKFIEMAQRRIEKLHREMVACSSPEEGYVLETKHTSKIRLLGQYNQINIKIKTLCSISKLAYMPS